MVRIDGGISLFCPSYTGKGFCCDQKCCTEEEWRQQSIKNKRDQIVIKDRFRYEDQTDKNQMEDALVTEVEEIIDDLEDINESLDKIVETERQRRRRIRKQVHSVNSWSEVYHVMLVSLIGLSLVLVITVTCQVCAKILRQEKTSTKPLVMTEARGGRGYGGIEQ